MRPDLWTPAPIGIASETLFSAADIEAYEREILANPSATETDASRFFSRIPRFLHLGNHAEIRREVVMVRPVGQARQRVDFFRRAYGRPFWDLIELKDPTVPTIVQADGLHPRLSAEVEKAISQALDYRGLIVANSLVRDQLKAKGVWVCRPQILVIVGRRDQAADQELVEVLYDRVRQRGPIEAWSYTDIYDFAKEHYAKNKLITVPSIHLATNERTAQQVAWDTMLAELHSNPDLLYTLPPHQFEQVVAHLLEAFGYTITLTPGRGDDGIDIVALHTGLLAETKLIIQCKRYAKDRKLGASDVRELLGVVAATGASKGLLVTTTSFTKEARSILGGERAKWAVEGKGFEDLVKWLGTYQDLLRGRDGNLLE